MNIGFVSTWFERGAAYVTRAYLDILKENNTVFVYARGGEELGKGNKNWDHDYVTWGLRLESSNINFSHFKKWIEANKIDCLFFNEQHDFEIIKKVKKNFPYIKVGAYIDYYKVDTVSGFRNYDFLICNTKRHYEVFEWHPQCYYIPWGTDVNLFSPQRKKDDEFVFFHSVGMSKRKGTKLLIEAFLDGSLYKYSKLIIHSQISIEENFGYSKDYLNNFNVEVIEKTVKAPGLYYLGDVYVYPTNLDGLGLTLYEALASGLPVITTNDGPMNEVIDQKNGCLIDVQKYMTRSDAYYWPLAIASKDSLIECMKIMLNCKNIDSMKLDARKCALDNWNWDDRREVINFVFSNSKVLDANSELKSTNPKFIYHIKEVIKHFAPDLLIHIVNERKIKIKRKI